MEILDKTCVYCKGIKENFNKEHIFPVSFGGTSKYLENLVCTDCNTRFNNEFEGKFLKGKGIESFLRALKGNIGRREYPIFGDGSYKNRLYEKIIQKYPPIQILVSNKMILAPLQMIGISESGKIYYSIIDEKESEKDFNKIFDKLYRECCSNEKCINVFLWINANEIIYSFYRNILKIFYMWLGINKLSGDLICEDINGIVVKLDWNTPERNRMYSKMALNLFFWLYNSKEICLLSNFDNIRRFVLDGDVNLKNPVKQWTSKNNYIVNKIGIDYDLAAGIISYNENIYGVIYFPIIGMFLIDIGSKKNVPNKPIQKDIEIFENEISFFVTLKNDDPYFGRFESKICIEISQGIINDSLFESVINQNAL